jgi:hypothetical protein
LREERRLRVFENKVLRRICGPKRYDITWEWRKLHTEELNDISSSPNIIWLMKSRKMRYSTYGGRGEACTGFWYGILREKTTLKTQA